MNTANLLLFLNKKKNKESFLNGGGKTEIWAKNRGFCTIFLRIIREPSRTFVTFKNLLQSQLPISPVAHFAIS